MIALGVDVGMSGAIAAIDAVSGTAVVEDLVVCEVPVEGRAETERRIDGFALRKTLLRLVPADRACVLLVEEQRFITNRPGAAQSQQLLVRNLGVIEGVCDGLRLRARLVSPQRWQSHYGLAGKKKETRAKGELHRSTKLALDLYPALREQLSRVSDHNRGEAVLIAHYCRQVHA